LVWNFGPSGGPGGQHANRSQTRAELSFDIARSEVFPEEVRELLLSRVNHVDGVVTVEASDTRSQWRNRQLARGRLSKLLTQAMRVRKRRRPTKPTRASVERRLQKKARRSEIKESRRSVDE